jgi:hypothetical protein
MKRDLVIPMTKDLSASRLVDLSTCNGVMVVC